MTNELIAPEDNERINKQLNEDLNLTAEQILEREERETEENLKRMEADDDSEVAYDEEAHLQSIMEEVDKEIAVLS